MIQAIAVRVKQGRHVSFLSKERFNALSDPTATLAIIPFEGDAIETIIEVFATWCAPRIDQPQLRQLVAAAQSALAKIALVALVGCAILGRSHSRGEYQ